MSGCEQGIFYVSAQNVMQLRVFISLSMYSLLIQLQIGFMKVLFFFAKVGGGGGRGVDTTRIQRDHTTTSSLHCKMKQEIGSFYRHDYHCSFRQKQKGDGGDTVGTLSWCCRFSNSQVPLPKACIHFNSGNSSQKSQQTWCASPVGTM